MAKNITHYIYNNSYNVAVARSESKDHNGPYNNSASTCAIRTCVLMACVCAAMTDGGLYGRDRGTEVASIKGPSPPGLVNSYFPLQKPHV